MNERIAERTRAAALLAGPGVIFLYLFYTGIHGWFAPLHGSRPIAIALGVGAVLTAALYAWMRMAEVRDPAPAIVAAALVGVGVSLTFLAVTGDPAQSVVTLVTIMAAAYFLVWRWATAIVIGSAFVGWFWLMPRDDSEIWIHWFINYSSACLLAVLVAEARRRLLRDLARKAAKLEAATLELRSLYDSLGEHNVALQEARDIAIRSNSGKNDLIANMSHEVRTPLSGVVGVLGLLEGTELTQQQKHYVKTARTSGDTLMRLINDMLDFSAMEAHKLKLFRREFVLMDIIESSIEILALDARRKNTALACVADPELPRSIVGDPERIQQALTNLLSNSVKHTEGGQIVVHIRKEVDQKQQSVVRISVTDTGEGIPDEEQDRVFESFYRVEDRAQGGKGLGLAITKQLILLMGGDIGFTSAVDEGSTFWFEFPLEAGVDTSEEQRTDPRVLMGSRVFVVEQEQAYQQQLDAILLGWGVDAKFYEDTAAALGGIDAGPPFEFGIISTGEGRSPAYKMGEDLRKRFGEEAPRLTLLLEIGETVNTEDLAVAGFGSAMSKPIRGVDLLKCLTTASWSGMFRATSHQVTPPERPGNNSILVADDNPVGQMVAKANLRALGYRVDTVSDGKQAIDAVATGTYAAVLMDCHMPVLDGLEATRRIREWERKLGRTHLPIIAVTASAMRTDREESQRAGMSGHLAKPYTLAALDEVLHRWLEERRVDNPENRPSKPPSPTPAVPEATQLLAPRNLGPPVLATQILDELEAINPKAARAAVKAFLHHTPIRFARLWAHIDKREVSDAAAVAHQVKGSAAQIGAEQIASMAAQIEAHYLDKLPGFPEITVTQLEAAYARLKAEIAPFE